jgi:small subunit ribosomal protein S6e
LVNFKIVISDKTGKSLSHELKDKDAQPFLGSKIGDSFDSSLVGLAGGKLQITGGSDKSGTPMRSDLHGEGKRVRKLLRGNMITEEIYQLNCILDGVNIVTPKAENSESPNTDLTK